MAEGHLPSNTGGGLRCASSAAEGVAAVEGEVQFDHVDAGFAEKAEGAAVGVRLDELTHLIRGDVAGVGDSCHLNVREPGEMCGSRPLPLAVTASEGTGVSVVASP